MAKAATQTQFEQVTALYEERQRFEAWLSALEAKRATTPANPSRGASMHEYSIACRVACANAA